MNQLRITTIIFDPLVAIWMVDPDASKNVNKKDVEEFDAIMSKFTTSYVRPTGESPQELLSYDLLHCVTLAESLKASLQSKDLMDALTLQETPLIQVILQMEILGIRVDRALLLSFKDSLQVCNNY